MYDFVFSAYYSDGSHVFFEAPQVWRHVFAACKAYSRASGCGANIYCLSGGHERFVRSIGPDDE